MIEVFHTPSGRTTLTAIEEHPFIYSWKPEGIVAQLFQLERIDDQNYRVAQAPASSAASSQQDKA
jgi:hypothetical protein